MLSGLEIDIYEIINFRIDAILFKKLDQLSENHNFISGVDTATILIVGNKIQFLSDIITIGIRNL